MHAKPWLTKDEPLADSSAGPEAQARREKTAPARAVARAVVRYRGEHGLSQTALAARLGMRQPHVARLEFGERHPTMETLERLSRVPGLRFLLDVAPTGAATEEITTPGGAGASRRRLIPTSRGVGAASLPHVRLLDERGEHGGLHLGVRRLGRGPTLDPLARRPGRR